ncbi:hypothetical protein [Paracoccus sp. IB05]|uniref:hypothetical protein n=1 Tax=Paracoccus sp. IB05 TaxID=2779367 RepID=UPI0018E87190|nr:hypothetical protein [Paracoccus sp. IB05]MBJ2151661.1 hypothetical protein [Paracoccus sp. IB05]
MDPVIGGALIQAGAGLLGGMFGKKANPGRDTRHVILNQVGTWREAGERFGFNPPDLCSSFRRHCRARWL